MHPADEFAHIKEQIAVLTRRARCLRKGNVDGSAPCLGDAHEESATERVQRTLMRGRLPRVILTDPAVWRFDTAAFGTIRDATANTSAPPPTGSEPRGRSTSRIYDDEDSEVIETF